MKGEGCLMVFTKNPILGTAKTRIGKVKGDDVALKVYKRLLTYTRDIASKVEQKKAVYFNQFIEEEGIWDEGFIKRMQVKGDLGTKMSIAFEEELRKSSKAIIIGSDCAEISTEDIHEAFELLNEADIVIGPANDGGYYLLGMNKYYPEIFKEMPWSQENLFDETIIKVKNLNLKYHILSPKSDIDFWEDWEKLVWDLEDT